jgi:hypothetical protein
MYRRTVTWLLYIDNELPAVVNFFLGENFPVLPITLIGTCSSLSVQYDGGVAFCCQGRTCALLRGCTHSALDRYRPLANDWIRYDTESTY